MSTADGADNAAKWLSGAHTAVENSTVCERAGALRKTLVGCARNTMPASPLRDPEVRFGDWHFDKNTLAATYLVRAPTAGNELADEMEFVDAKFAKHSHGVGLVPLREAQQSAGEAIARQPSAQDVGQHARPLGEQQVLKHDPDGSFSLEVFNDLAFRWLDRPCQACKQAGLSNSRGTGQGDEFSRLQA